MNTIYIVSSFKMEGQSTLTFKEEEKDKALSIFNKLREDLSIYQASLCQHESGHNVVSIDSFLR